MDFLPDLSKITEWLVQYGSLFLFISFALGILILPVPEETMMLLAGTLIKKGKLSFSSTLTGAVLGSLCGITLSYGLGRLFGTYIFEKYGKWVGITPAKIQKVHRWFEKYGKWSLTFGYFIPGIRHFTGLSAGATKLPFRSFMLFAYTGALAWVSIFLSLGYFLGHIAFTVYEKIEFTFDNVIMLVLSIVVVFFLGLFAYMKLIKKKRSRKKPKS